MPLPQFVTLIATHLTKGVPLDIALNAAFDLRQMTVEQWDKLVGTQSALSAMYSRIVRDWILDLYAQCQDATMKTLPGLCWIAERRHAQWFSNNTGIRQGNQVTVHVNTVVGLPEDIIRRAATYVEKQRIGADADPSKQTPKQLAAAQVIDVESVPQPIK